MNESLADEILRMAKTDQAMRGRVINSEAWHSSIRVVSQSRLMVIIDNSAGLGIVDEVFDSDEPGDIYKNHK